VPIGIHLIGPAICLYIGAAGFGKTVGMRRQVLEQDEWNLNHPELAVPLIVLDFKGDYPDIPGRSRERCRRRSEHAVNPPV
jgi:hypothetical protein